MVIHKIDQNFDIQQEQGNNKDLLILRGKFKIQNTTIILVYLSVVKGEEERKHNQQVHRDIKKYINKNEDDILILLGDFNGHIGIIGEQPQKFNRKIVLDLMSECRLVLVNATEKCNTCNTYTWSRGEQRSAINFILMNDKGYQKSDIMNILLYIFCIRFSSFELI